MSKLHQDITPRKVRKLHTSPVMSAAEVWEAQRLLTARCGWERPIRWLLLALVRDVMIVPIWLLAIWRNKFDCQGHAMSFDDLGVAS